MILSKKYQKFEDDARKMFPDLTHEYVKVLDLIDDKGKKFEVKCLADD